MCYCEAFSYYSVKLLCLCNISVTFKPRAHIHINRQSALVDMDYGCLGHSVRKGCISSVLSLEPLVECECGAF